MFPIRLQIVLNDFRHGINVRTVWCSLSGKPHDELSKFKCEGVKFWEVLFCFAFSRNFSYL